MGSIRGKYRRNIGTLIGTYGKYGKHIETNIGK
jgi:hypothetical protein